MTTVNDVYQIFQRIIRSDGSLSLSQKEIAFNEGYLLFAEKMINKCSGFDELVVINTLETFDNDNKVSLPDDFFKLWNLWKLVGTDYYKFQQEANVTYQRLTDISGNNFFNTNDTGEPCYFAILKPYIYFDRHISDGDEDGIKIAYFKKPDTVDFYDRLPITGVSGTFQVNEIVTGSSSNTTATIKAVSATYLDIYSETINGEFSQSETITGNTSSATATTNGAISQKPQTLEIGSEYANMLAYAIATVYFEMRGISEEAQAKEATLDNLIRLRQFTNLNNKRLRMSLR